MNTGPDGLKITHFFRIKIKNSNNNTVAVDLSRNEILTSFGKHWLFSYIHDEISWSRFKFLGDVSNQIPSFPKIKTNYFVRIWFQWSLHVFNHFNREFQARRMIVYKQFVRNHIKNKVAAIWLNFTVTTQNYVKISNSAGSKVMQFYTGQAMLYMSDSICHVPNTREM